MDLQKLFDYTLIVSCSIAMLWGVASKDPYIFVFVIGILLIQANINLSKLVRSN